MYLKLSPNCQRALLFECFQVSGKISVHVKMRVNGENRKPKRPKKKFSLCYVSKINLTVLVLNSGLRGDSLANHRLSPITE